MLKFLTAILMFLSTTSLGRTIVLNGQNGVNITNGSTVCKSMASTLDEFTNDSVKKCETSSQNSQINQRQVTNSWTVFELSSDRDTLVTVSEGFSGHHLKAYVVVDGTVFSESEFDLQGGERSYFSPLLHLDLRIPRGTSTVYFANLMKPYNLSSSVLRLWTDKHEMMSHALIKSLSIISLSFGIHIIAISVLLVGLAAGYKQSIAYCIFFILGCHCALDFGMPGNIVLPNKYTDIYNTFVDATLLVPLGYLFFLLFVSQTFYPRISRTLLIFMSIPILSVWVSKFSGFPGLGAAIATLTGYLSLLIFLGLLFMGRKRYSFTDKLYFLVGHGIQLTGMIFYTQMTVNNMEWEWPLQIAPTVSFFIEGLIMSIFVSKQIRKKITKHALSKAKEQAIKADLEVQRKINLMASKLELLEGDSQTFLNFFVKEIRKIYGNIGVCIITEGARSENAIKRASDGVNPSELEMIHDIHKKVVFSKSLIRQGKTKASDASLISKLMGTDGWKVYGVPIFNVKIEQVGFHTPCFLKCFILDKDKKINPGLIEIFLRHLASLLKRMEVLKRAEEKSYIDDKTGLLNNKYLEDKAIQELEKTFTGIGEVYSIIYADLGDFKALNTKYNHTGGDTCLELVAEILNTGKRKDDLAIRISGDEFAVILPSTTAQEALNVAKRIRELSHELFKELHPVDENDREKFMDHTEKVYVTLDMGISDRTETQSFKETKDLSDSRSSMAKEQRRGGKKEDSDTISA